MYRYLFSFILLSFLWVDDVSAQIDYHETIQPIFNSRCTSCHGGANGLNGVLLTSYDAVMNSVGVQYGTHIVEPGNPDDSPIVDKISSNNPRFGNRMPGDGTQLSDQQISDIRQWIEEGAHESVETSAETIAGLPDQFKITGNYPNPFNPSTTIRLEIPESSHYRLSVYSVLGSLVYTSSGRLQPGRHNLPVNLNARPSGMYLYRIHFTGSNESVHTLSGRMTLVK